MSMRICILSIALLLSGCSTSPYRVHHAIEVDGSTTAAPATDLQHAADEAYARNDWGAATTYYESLVTQFPTDAGYWYRLGNVYAFDNKLDAAVVAYRQSLGLEPGSADTWFNLGMTQLKQSAYSLNAMQSRATADSEKAVKAQRIIDGILELLQTPE